MTRQAARAQLEEVADRARAEGLVARFGRKVLELRPPVDAHKGTAVTHLLGERNLARALYAGDDTTDLDAFAALAGLELGVKVGRRLDRRPAGAARGRRHRRRRPRRGGAAAGAPLGGLENGLGSSGRELLLPDQHERCDDAHERDRGPDPERELEP